MEKKDTTAFAIIGLGNPGKNYQDTMHNTGQNALDLFVKNHSKNFTRSKKLQIAKITLKNLKLFCMKSEEFLNISGYGYFQLIKQNQIINQNIILLADDIDLSLGSIIIQLSKAHGGNNGIKSLFNHIKKDPIIKIRIGIGRPLVKGIPTYESDEIAKWVLSKPKKKDQELLKQSIIQASLAIDSILINGLEITMNKFNHKI